MIKDIFITILPSLLIILCLAGVVVVIKAGELKIIILAILLGLLAIIPAILIMRGVMLLTTITLPVAIPIIIIRLLSAINEEYFKLLAIKYYSKSSNKIVYAIFVGAGFALGETLFIALGNPELSIIRSVTALPLHVVTALILAIYTKEKKDILFIAAIIVHVGYNLTIR